MSSLFEKLWKDWVESEERPVDPLVLGESEEGDEEAAGKEEDEEAEMEF